MYVPLRVTRSLMSSNWAMADKQEVGSHDLDSDRKLTIR